jgi:hypothetical protein
MSWGFFIACLAWCMLALTSQWTHVCYGLLSLSSSLSGRGTWRWQVIKLAFPRMLFHGCSACLCSHGVRDHRNMGGVGIILWLWAPSYIAFSPLRAFALLHLRGGAGAGASRLHIWNHIDGKAQVGSPVGQVSVSPRTFCFCWMLVFLFNKGGGKVRISLGYNELNKAKWLSLRLDFSEPLLWQYELWVSRSGILYVCSISENDPNTDRILFLMVAHRASIYEIHLGNAGLAA